jgi:hypothetical protein
MLNDFGAFEPNSLRNKTGNYFSGTGNFGARTGNFIKVVSKQLPDEVFRHTQRRASVFELIKPPRPYRRITQTSNVSSVFEPVRCVVPSVGADVRLHELPSRKSH